MNFAYYLTGTVLTIVLTILYNVVENGRVELTQASLITLAFQAAIATISFVIAGYIFKTNK
jgi:hypothetical protein